MVPLALLCGEVRQGSGVGVAQAGRYKHRKPGAIGPEGSEGACRTHGGRSLEVCLTLLHCSPGDCDFSGGCTQAGIGLCVLSVEG